MIFNPDKRLIKHSLPSIIYLNDVHQGQEKDLSKRQLKSLSLFSLANST